MSVLTATIDGSDSCRSSYGYLSLTDIGKLGFFITVLGNIANTILNLTSGSAKHIIVNLGGAIDGDIGCTCITAIRYLQRPAEAEVIQCLFFIICTSVLHRRTVEVTDYRSDGTHGTTAIHTIRHFTAMDSNIGVACHKTSPWVVMLIAIIASIGVSTATRTIYITTGNRSFLYSSGIRKCCPCVACESTHFAAIHFDYGITSIMTVFTAAKDRTPNLGIFRIGARGTNLNKCFVDPC